MSAVELLRPHLLEEHVGAGSGAVVRLADALGPISPELALVDPDLAARARALLPGPVEPVVRLRPQPAPLAPRDAQPVSEVEAVPASPARFGSRKARGALVAVVAVAAVIGLGAWKGAPLLSDGQPPSAAVEEKPVLFSAPPVDPSLAPQAVAALEQQARLRPRSALVREKLGSVYLRLERWTDAEREFRALVALAPGDDFAHFALGRALEEQGRHTEAKEHFARADELRRADPAAVPPSP